MRDSSLRFVTKLICIVSYSTCRAMISCSATHSEVMQGLEDFISSLSANKMTCLSDCSVLAEIVSFYSLCPTSPLIYNSFAIRRIDAKKKKKVMTLSTKISHWLWS